MINISVAAIAVSISVPLTNIIAPRTDKHSVVAILINIDILYVWQIP